MTLHWLLYVFLNIFVVVNFLGCDSLMTQTQIFLILLGVWPCQFPPADPGPTVSVGKGFGSKGKQHHKHTGSETQSHNKWSQQMQNKSLHISKSAQTRH